jgi:hypothetical protein
MKLRIFYKFEDTESFVKEFNKDTNVIGSRQNETEKVSEWLTKITKEGFFEADTAKGKVLLPTRNILHIKVE